MNLWWFCQFLNMPIGLMIILQGTGDELTRKDGRIYDNIRIDDESERST